MTTNITFRVGEYEVPLEALQQSKVTANIGWALYRGRAVANYGIQNKWIEPTESFDPKRFGKNPEQSLSEFSRHVRCLSQLVEDLEEQKAHPIRQKCFALLKVAITITLLSGAILGFCLAAPHLALAFSILVSVWNGAVAFLEAPSIEILSNSPQKKLLLTVAALTGCLPIFLLFQYYDAKILEELAEPKKHKIQEFLESVSEFAHLIYRKPSLYSNTYINPSASSDFSMIQEDVLNFLRPYKTEAKQVS